VTTLSGTRNQALHVLTDPRGGCWYPPGNCLALCNADALLGIKDSNGSLDRILLRALDMPQASLVGYRLRTRLNSTHPCNLPTQRFEHPQHVPLVVASIRSLAKCLTRKDVRGVGPFYSPGIKVGRIGRTRAAARFGSIYRMRRSGEILKQMSFPHFTSRVRAKKSDRGRRYEISQAGGANFH
jgi:hypothetical protein